MTEPRTLVAGETLVDFLPERAGPLGAVDGFSRRPGGAPANVAVGLTRLGDAPWFWTRVGREPFGDFLASTLVDEGVPARFVERDTDAKTTLAFLSYDADGDRRFTFYRDRTADTRLLAGTVSDEVLDQVGWVYLGGVSFASEPARTAMFDLLERATGHGCTTVFDPNARPELWSDFDFEATIESVLPQVDIVKATPGDLDLAGFEPESHGALAAAVCDRGPHTVFLTLGRDGAIARTTADSPWGRATVRHPGYRVDVEDPTGAGDAFTAGVLAALVAGESALETVLGRGNAVAALATTATGAMSALPARERLDAFDEVESR